jgi:TonB family protein
MMRIGQIHQRNRLFKFGFLTSCITLIFPLAPNVWAQDSNMQASAATPVVGDCQSATPNRLDAIDFAPYMKRLQDRIRTHWSPPSANENNSVVVRFSVSRDGRVSDLGISKITGPADPDDSGAALAAIKSAAPFEALPSGSPETVQIEFTFDINVTQNNSAEKQDNSYYLANDFSRAVDCYSAAITINAQRAQRAQLYLSRGIAREEAIKHSIDVSQAAHAAAIADFTQAIALQPKLRDAYLARAKAYTDTNKLASALADYAMAIRIDEKNAATYVERGLVYIELKRKQDAIASFTQAIAADAKCVDAYFHRASLFSELRDYQKAIDDLTKSLSLNPNDAAIYNNRGRAHAELGHYQSAIADFSRAYDLDPAWAGWRGNIFGGAVGALWRGNWNCTYIDKDGKSIVSAPNLSGRFSEGLATLSEGALYGYIDKEKKYVIKPQFVFAGEFHDGLALASLPNQPAGFIDHSGHFVLKPSYRYLNYYSHFSEGLMTLSIGVRQAYINKSGKVVIKPLFEVAGNFSQGLAPVKIGSKTGYIDTTGAFVIPPQFAAGGNFHDGLAAVLIVPPDDSRSLHERKTSRHQRPNTVPIGTTYAFVNMRGELIGKPRPLPDKAKLVIRWNPPHDMYLNGDALDTAIGFSDGLAPTFVGTKCGFMDTAAKTVIPAQFDDVGPFKEGLAAALVDKHWGFIDKAGNFVIKPQFDFANQFSDGLALIGKPLSDSSPNGSDSPGVRKSDKLR